MRLYQQINGINRKRICKFIVVTILFVSFSSIFLNSSIVVYAWSAGGLRSTIASIIVSMLMSSGAGVTNMDWLNQLNTAYGVESSIGTLENAINQGLLTESSGTLIDTGLSNAIMSNSAYTELGLNDLFTTTASDATIQAGTIAATGGANIAAESISTITLGTVGQAFVTVGAGIGLGVLANHFIEKYGDSMLQGLKITDLLLASNLYPGGDLRYGSNADLNKRYYLLQEDMYVCSMPSQTVEGRYTGYIFLKTIGDTKQYKTNTEGSSNFSTVQITDTNSFTLYDANNNFKPLFSNRTEVNEYISNVRNGIITPTNNNVSPDVIGEEGNQRGSYDSEIGYNFPAIKPYYDPTEKGLQPIDMDDYLDFAEYANDLTDDDLTGTDQADHFIDFINPYLEEHEAVVPDPDPDYTDPSTIPEQPEYTPKTPVSTEDINDSDPYTTPDLMDRFPFCIPSDILSIFQKFKMSREAPIIDWEFKYDEIGLDHHLIIDLSDYDDAASLLRNLEIILFVVGLGVATRKLLGA